MSIIPPPFARVLFIQRLVGDAYGVSQTDMLGPDRHRSIARPRQVAMYLSKRNTIRSLPEIGRCFGGRDHTTVIHAIRQIEHLRARDVDLDAQIAALEHCIPAAPIALAADTGEPSDQFGAAAA